MAQFTFTITYPDEKQDEVLEALHAYYGEKEPGVPYTALELRGLLQDYFRNHLKRIYRRHHTVPTDLDAY